MLDTFYQSSRNQLQNRFWVFSDLQQALPDMAEECLQIALRDMEPYQKDIDQIWYLGDAMEGKRPERIAEMVGMQVRNLQAFGVPVRYIMGNHDLDMTTAAPADTAPVLPAYEAFSQVPGWRTTPTFSDLGFTEVYGQTLVVFLSDHVDPRNRWFATQQEIRGTDPESYPHGPDTYRKLREDIAAWEGPVVIAGHYAFPGGPRGTPSHGPVNQLLPLPDNVQLVLHGHAHTGDWPYGKEKTYQRLGWIDWHPVPQANISSLDRTRGSQTRSAVLDFYEDGTIGLYFRDHEDHTWSDAFFLETRAPRTRSDANIRHHNKRTSLEGTQLAEWRRQHQPQSDNV